ncbi:aliphatic sulfonate ABC transporter substrate-binding protein [Carnimonas bestiolae]|uniref:aliphatic sulfonate ABC transporter substrate-binding protein n=1 Tax=Carnimonas bestiolae TaxID=3402172 RepID=UPI003EDB9558
MAGWIKKITMKRWMGALLVAAVGLSAASGAAAAQRLSIGYQKGSGVLAVLKAQGGFEKHLAEQGIQVSWHEFPAGPQLLEALNAGSLDFGYTGAPPPVFAQAAGIDLRYVAAVKASPDAEGILVPENSDISSLSALKGKRVAVQKGSSANYLLLEALEHEGLSFKDIQPAYLSPADARAAFANGSVDAWAVWDPYFGSAQHDLHARVVGAGHDFGAAYSFYQASAQFTEQHPELLNQLLQELGKTSLWVNAHREEVSDILAKELGLPREVILGWQKKLDYRLIPLDDKVIADQQQVADAFAKQHLIPAPIKVGEYFWRKGEFTAK